jgi:phage tail-like protein
MPPTKRDDPYGVYNFQVTVTGISDDGLAVGGSFTEVSGLELEVPPIDYRNGSDALVIRKMPGVPKPTNVTLRKGISGHVEFWNWILRAMNGQVFKTDGAIILLDENRQEVMRWKISRAWPTKYTGPGLNATNNEIAMETLELAVEKLEIDV